jgi:hypothetical protein
MDIKKMKPPRAITGNVSDLLQPSLCVLIHTPNIITATANSIVRRLTHLITKVLVPIPIFSRLLLLKNPSKELKKDTKFKEKDAKFGSGFCKRLRENKWVSENLNFSWGL